MTVLMCITWTVLFVLTIVAFWKGLIFISNEEDVIKDSYIITLPEPTRTSRLGDDRSSDEIDSNEKAVV